MSKIKLFSLGGLNENGKNMFVMEIDDDCIPFKKEKIFSKMSWVKKRPTHFCIYEKN